MKRLLISGFEGRMGQETANLAPRYGFEPLPFSPTADATAVIDFSHPDCLPALLQSSLPLVIGTTGYTREQQLRIRQAAEARPIFQAANFSIGIYALTAAAKTVKALLPDWDACLIERHHADKQDSPSGTALTLADAVGVSQLHAVRAGTLRGVHELGFYGPEESIILLHTAESRALFAHGALRAAIWLENRKSGLYGMADMLATDTNAPSQRL